MIDQITANGDATDSSILRGSRAFLDCVAAPEPARFALLALGLAGLGFSRRKQ